MDDIQLGVPLLKTRRHKESELEKFFVNYCKKVNLFQKKLKWVNYAGAPDRMIIEGGKTFYIELKRQSGKLSAVQVKIHRELNGLGALVFVVKDVVSLIRLLDNIKGVKDSI